MAGRCPPANSGDECSYCVAAKGARLWRRGGGGHRCQSAIGIERGETGGQALLRIARCLCGGGEGERMRCTELLPQLMMTWRLFLKSKINAQLIQKHIVEISSKTNTSIGACSHASPAARRQQAKGPKSQRQRKIPTASMFTGAWERQCENHASGRLGRV